MKNTKVNKIIQFGNEIAIGVNYKGINYLGTLTEQEKEEIKNNLKTNIK